MRHNKAKDNNNKVCTTRGWRDRRIRLSPNTAIQFYDVQDRLGYDRSSLVIDWLMKEAKVAIDALNVDHQEYQAPNKSTLFNHLDTFHDRTQHTSSHDHTNGFNIYPYGLMNLINKCQTEDENPIVVPQEINLFSASTAPENFNWNTNCNRGEGVSFAGREPLQSSFSSSISRHTLDNHFANENGFLGFHFDQEIQAQEDEKDNTVPKHCRHYQD